jgi:hypothetical protein
LPVASEKQISRRSVPRNDKLKKSDSKTSKPKISKRK